MKTNRDLYKSIESLLKEKSDTPLPPLEEYLSNLLSLAQQLADRSALSLEEFFGLLRDAFVGATIPPAPAIGNTVPAFAKWQAQVAQQIQDLREMAQQGQLENEYRYFGVNAPSGERWFNFDPCTYIECGVVGSIGGWEEGDDTGRSYVPGPVACVGPDGRITPCDPRERQQAPVEMPSLTWEVLSDFVWYGQNYE